LIAVIIAVTLWAIMGTRAAGSALLAGAISASTTVYMGRKMLSIQSGDPHQMLSTIYVAEFIKLAFTATFFCLAFLVFKVHALAFLGTYAATVLVFAAALAMPGLRE
jgi:F0F1-type ATP synthase assembly protein I